MSFQENKLSTFRRADMPGPTRWLDSSGTIPKHVHVAGSNTLSTLIADSTIRLRE
jgi:hypothetical protein